MNKIISKKYLEERILSQSIFFLKEEFDASKLLKKIKINKIKFPIMEKRINEGSSIGVNICKNIRSLSHSTKRLFKKYSN